jgi:hypothetical protein
MFLRIYASSQMSYFLDGFSFDLSTINYTKSRPTILLVAYKMKQLEGSNPDAMLEFNEFYLPNYFFGLTTSTLLCRRNSWRDWQ